MLPASLLGLVLLAALARAAAPGCASTRLRKEMRDLNATEWRAFTSAVVELKRRGRMDQYTAVHQQYTQPAHGGVLFLAWHRRFVYAFETELLSITGPALSGMPYFDPLRSYNVFDPASAHFIGNAQGCVTSGPFAGFRSVTGACVSHALSEDADFVDPRVVAQLILTGSSFSNFATAYEGGQHAAVHNTVGGQMASLQYAPDDPMFYLHHSNVDRIWYRRQYANVARLYWDYSGTHAPGGVGQVSLNTPIPPWQDRVGAVTDVYRTMCYDYADPGARADGAPSALARRDAPRSRFDLMHFARSAPLRRCTPMAAAHLARMGMASDFAQRACDIVNAEVARMEADGRAPDAWPLPDELHDADGAEPRAWDSVLLAADGQ